MHARIAHAELYRRTGLQFLPFNTIYQLAAEGRLAEAEQLLLIPDLVASALTGVNVCERTNASTTGLLDVRTGDWDPELLALVGLDPSRMPELVEPGTVIGEARAATPVVAVGSHDTASAVVGVPLTDPDAAYISCGTWGLVGVELDRPVLTEEARLANFTNEGGVDGRTRFLTNVMGTWLLSETLRTWGESDLSGLLAQAEAYGGTGALFDVQDPRFLAPGDMPVADRRLVPRARRRAAGRPRGDRAEHRPQPGRGVRRRGLAAVLALRAAASAVCTSSAAAPRTRCSASSSPTASACRSSPARSRRPRSATCSSRRRALGALSGTLEDLRALVARTHPPDRLPPRSPLMPAMKRQFPKAARPRAR